MKQSNRIRLLKWLFGGAAVVSLALFFFLMERQETKDAWHCCIFFGMMLLGVSQVQELERKEKGKLLYKISNHFEKHFRYQRSACTLCCKAAELLDKGGRENLEEALGLLLKAEWKCFRKADRGAVLFLTAEVQDRLRRQTQAVESLRKSVALDKDNPAAWNMLGLLLVRAIGADAFQEAEQAYRRALALSPGFGLAMGNLGALYYRRENYPLAREWLEKALERQEYPTFLAAMALTEAAEGHESAWTYYARAEKAGYQSLSGLHAQIEEKLQERGRSTWVAGCGSQQGWEQFNKEW